MTETSAGSPPLSVTVSFAPLARVSPPVNVRTPPADKSRFWFLKRRHQQGFEGEIVRGLPAMAQACLAVPTVALAVLALVTVPSELRVIVPHRQLSVSVPEARPVGPVWEYSPQPPSKLTKHLNCRCPPLTPTSQRGSKDSAAVLQS